MYIPIFSKGISTVGTFLFLSSLCFILAFFSLILYFALRDAEEVIKASNGIRQV